VVNDIISGIMGLCVADAIGVPVEFMNREQLEDNPVVDMRSGGPHNQPIGTWSDDSSMTLCLIDSLINGLDYEDIMKKFIKWYKEGEYTATGVAFDIGEGTRKALNRFSAGMDPLECGGKAEHDNGNGSLMRILPILFYIQSKYGVNYEDKEEIFEIIHNISSLTHAHKRSKIACGIYISIALKLKDEVELETAIKYGINEATKYYKSKLEFADEIEHFKRITSENFYKLPKSEIKSSGYVVDTIEAAIWCLLNTKGYKECVLKCVNLGNDTDTVAAIAGGLAGIYYGYDNIPKEWINKIARKEYIENLCNELDYSLV